MKVSKLLEKLWVEKEEFVTSDDLRAYCKTLRMDYDTALKNFIHRKHLTRIFRGIFYVRPPENFVLKGDAYTHLELVAKGMELKRVKNWYFALHTALKLNNMTHEYFMVDDLVSDVIFRPRPISIAGHKFKFTKLAPSLFGFGIKKHGLLLYSDPEKTILDFVYLFKQNGVSDSRTTMDVGEWSENASKGKIRKYCKNYPKSVQGIARELVK